MKWTPVLVLAAILAAFMTFDRLKLHWYTPDVSPPRAVRAPDQPTAATSSTPPSPRPATATPANETPTPGDWSHPEVRGAFESLRLAGPRATYRARYQASEQSGGVGHTYVVFNMPPLARIDIIPSSQSGPSSQIFVDALGKTIACSINTSGRQCSSIQPFVLPLPDAAGPIVFPDVSTFPSLGVVEMYPKTIAGLLTRCFQVPAGDHELATEYCFTAEGVPLYANGPSGLVEASEFSSSVSNADMQPPPTP